MKTYKTKNWRIKRRIELTLLASTMTCVAIIGYFGVSATNAIESTVEGNFEPKKAIVEPSIREWVLNEVAKADLDPKTIDCIITRESRWNDWEQRVNDNHSTDSGLWQINSIHKKTIKLEDRFDYKKATKWSINKIKADGGYDAWVAYKFCK